MKRSIIAITACAIFAFTACNKKDTVAPAKTTQQAQAKAMTATATLYSPENPANEYDIAGQMHNAALTQFMTDPSGTDAFTSDWMDYTGNFLESNGYSKEGFIATMTNTNTNEILGTFNPFGVNELTPTVLNNWSAAGAISTNLKNYYTNVNNLIDALGKSGDYNSFKSSMIQLERSAESFNDNDKILALSTSSIARYSFAYWLNNNPTGGGMAMPMGWGKADFAGACAGGTRCIIAAFFGGPVGWGAWAGAVIGTGAGASIGYAIGSH